MDTDARPLKRIRQDVDVEAIVGMLEAAPSKSTETSLTAEAVKQALGAVHAHWTTKAEGSDIALIAADRFGFKDKYTTGELVPTGPTGLRTAFEKKLYALERLRYHFVRLGVMTLSESDIGGAVFRTQFSKVHMCMRRLYDALMTNLMARKTLDPQWALDCPSEMDPYYITPFDPEKLNSGQAFEIFVLEQLQKQGYKRYRGACYEEIETEPMPVQGPDGMKMVRYKTHAWKHAMEIAEFVRRAAPKETQFEMWSNKTTGNNLERVIKNVTFNFDMQFPVLVPNRNWHAFKNGLLNVSTRAFYKYGDPKIPTDTVACKYHDSMLDLHALEVPNWRLIKTPFLDRVLKPQFHFAFNKPVDKDKKEYKYTADQAEEENDRRFEQLNALRQEQGLEPLDDLPDRQKVAAGDPVIQNEADKVREWAYAFIGRMLFELNQHDSWQVVPIFIGKAGTGKSLLLSTIGKFFNDNDVGVVGNDNQKIFGLETIYDKMMWMCKEVKNDMSLDQAQLQSMITGEEVSVSRKGLAQVTVVWRAPGILAGNELANWSDNSGSMSRRLVLFRFDQKVMSSDPMLGKSLEAEIPTIIYKCASAYHDKRRLYGSKDLWADDPLVRQLYADREDPFYGSRTILPSYFHTNKNTIKESTHFLVNFLNNSDEIVIRPMSEELGIPWEDDHNGTVETFKSLAMRFFKKLDVSAKFPWGNRDKWEPVLEEFGLLQRPLLLKDMQRFQRLWGQDVVPDGTDGPKLAYGKTGAEYGIGKKWVFGLALKSELPT